jgi:3-oxoacyl-[acyl-carrier-protein] synthase II
MTRDTMPVGVTGLGVAIRGLRDPAALLDPRKPDAEAPDPVDGLTGRGIRYKDRATRLAMVAAHDALADAGLLSASSPAAPDDMFGVVTSTNLGNVDTICETVRTIADETYAGTSPMMLPATSSNVVASWLAITHGLRGPNLTLCNGPTSGLDAAQWARLLVVTGRARRVLVVGVEPDAPAVRHVASNGTGEADPLFDGAAAIVLEPVHEARARGARLLAEMGRYARRRDTEAATGAVCPRGTRVGLWLPPSGSPRPAAGGDASAHDLSAVFGSASGALGVLQIVAGTAWLDGDPGRTEAALAACGTGEADDDATAALLLSAPGAR